jgi:hypothetical protein
VRFGVGIVEVTRGQNGTHWHAHLHILAYADYMNQRDLSHLWSRITHGSHIVDIRQVRGSAHVTDYVTSYVTKPPDDVTQHSAELTAEWYEAVTRQHWVLRFGRKGLVPPREEKPRFSDWLIVCSLEQLLREDGPEHVFDSARARLLKQHRAEHEGLLNHVIDST